MKIVKTFYAHLIDISVISSHLDKLDFEPEQKEHLSSLAHSSIHHSIINTVMSELSEEERETFLRHLSNEDHQSIWQLFETRTKLIEEKIKQTFQSLSQEILHDLGQ